MADQVQKEKPAQDKKSKGEASPKDLKSKGEEIKAKADDILDEIDEVLEKNAEQFVANYVQRGGE